MIKLYVIEISTPRHCAFCKFESKVIKIYIFGCIIKYMLKLSERNFLVCFLLGNSPASEFYMRR